MRFTALVTAQSAVPTTVRPVEKTVEAASQEVAARMIADWAAEVAFGEQGMSTILQWAGKDHYRAFIGAWAGFKDGYGVTKGTGITILFQ
jgi:hypothetical protein